MNMDLEAREQESLELIRKLPLESYVLIGGYAASSYDFPRFSVDLDIVISKKTQKRFAKLLQSKKFKAVEIKAKAPKDKYEGNFQRFEKDMPKGSVDLLINSVISRQTESSYSFEYLYKNSEIREIVGFSSNAKIRARVANREMLIALKANSMRLADIRDIVALCNAEINTEVICRHLKRCPRDKILQNFEVFSKTLNDPKHKDSLKGVFRMPDSIYERVLERAKRILEELSDKLRSS